MKHLFVPYELAVKLKEKGFDEHCPAFMYLYEHEVRFTLSTIANTNSSWLSSEDKSFVSAPLYQQVIDWLHLKGFNLHDYWLPDEKMFGCDVYNLDGDLLFSDLAAGKGGKYIKKEEAWNKAIEEALKLIL